MVSRARLLCLLIWLSALNKVKAVEARKITAVQPQDDSKDITYTVTARGRGRPESDSISIG